MLTDTESGVKNSSQYLGLFAFDYISVAVVLWFGSKMVKNV